MIRFNMYIPKVFKKYYISNVLLRCEMLGLKVDELSTTSGVSVFVTRLPNSTCVRVYNLDHSVQLFKWEDFFTW